MTDGRLMLLDTAAMYFRAFHGVPDSVRAPSGEPVNAVRGLLDMIARLVAQFEPTALVACWDDDWRPAWRVELVPSYKAHRVAESTARGDVETVPAELVAQVPVIRETLDALGVPIVGAAGYEADDVIGTLAATASASVDVVTGDRDLFQVVDDARSVRVVYTGRGMSRLEVVTAAVLEAKYGVSPDQYADFAVLRGDPSDGLPGLAGVGEKTAASLLATHGSLEGIVEAARERRLSATFTAKVNGAAEQLEAASRIVAVVRDLDLGEVPLRIGVPEASRGRLAELKARWGLGESVERAITALDARAAAGIA